MSRALVVLALCMASGRAFAAAPTVAVMPFKDLSGGKGAIGEAIRETVTADLKEIRGITVIERSAIDRVLSEQSLQQSRADLDPLATVKIGKLLGASMIVTGAYQRAAATIRLTARFVRVETGEIIGSAKVDGDAADFLRLQDRVTGELLRSAGIDGGQVKKYAQRVRPKVKSMRAVELYGDAVVEPDEQKRGEILRLALDEDPSFTYAIKDLEALEKRVEAYAAKADVAQEREQRELAASILAEKDPTKRSQMRMQMLSKLISTRRHRALEREARAILAGPPPPAPPGNVRLDEIAGFYLLMAEGALKEHDAQLRDGELFMRRFPTSVYFKGVEQLVKSAIAVKRKQEEGKQAAPASVAALQSSERWDLCRVASIYQRAGQHREAQRLFRACVTIGSSAKEGALEGLVSADIECGDWAAARRDLKLFDADKSERARSYQQSLEMQIPTDD